MQYFFANSIVGNTIRFDIDEAQHLRKTLRKRTGDQVQVLDGKGSVYDARLELEHKKEVTAQILNTQRQAPDQYQLQVAVAPTKNQSRMEWFVEKSVELGIHRFTPLITRRTERSRLRLDRLYRIAVSALKQSGRTWLPVIDEAIELETLLSVCQAEQRYIAHCVSDDAPHLGAIVQSGGSSLVLIGPEGDFTSDEIDMALKYHFSEISLGPHRLRTETAGVFVTSIFAMINYR